MAGRRKIDIIVNPVAGSRDSGLFDAVLRHLQKAGAEVRCFETEGPGHAAELARRCSEEGWADVIVAGGGDGTINEVARGMIGVPIPLGIIPLGTANVLAIETGLKVNTRAVAETLLSGPAKLIGTGTINGELFLLMVGAGFDGRVVTAIDPVQKKKIGKLAFVWEGLKDWMRGPGAELVLSLDGREERAAWVIVCNAKHYAGPFILVRDADITEPGLDVCLFRNGSRLAFALYFLGLGVGRVGWLPWVDIVRARSVTLIQPEKVAIEIDGDGRGLSALEIAQGDRFLRLAMPV